MKQNKEDRHINDQAKKDFEEAKAAFAGFKDIDWVMPDGIVINEGALPKISSEEADKRIEAAMERLYGKDEEKKD